MNLLSAATNRGTTGNLSIVQRKNLSLGFLLTWTCEGGAAAGAGRAFSAHLSDAALDCAALFAESGG